VKSNIILWPLLALAGCSVDTAPRKITESGEVTVQPGDAHLNASSRERFPNMFSGLGGHGSSGGSGVTGGGGGGGGDSFGWMSPKGWKQLPQSEFRQINLQPPDCPDIDCYMSVAAGGVLNNVNRWLGQFGRPPIDEAALAKLPRRKLLSLKLEAIEVEAEGPFKDMQGTEHADWKMLGLVADEGGRQIFVKMTGPKAKVDQNKDGFETFAMSLRRTGGAGGAAMGQGGGAMGPGGAGITGHAADPAATSTDFDYLAPSSWTVQPPAQFRLINLRPADDPDLDCYVSVASGGVLANVNRWRKQFDQGGIDQGALDAAPRQKLLGGDAIRIEVTGDFAGMGNAKKSGYKLVGLVLDQGVRQVFVKMTGPQEKVDAEQADFDAFVASLRVRGAAANGAPAPGPAAAPNAPTGNLAESLKWDAPAGWTKQSDKPMRVVSYSLGANGQTECYVTVFPGDVGGLEANVQRWRGQMGLANASDEEIAKLPTLKVLGVDATIVDLSGSFDDTMTGRKFDSARFLGAIVPVPGWTLFVKMTGPEPEVTAAKDAFTAFCQSLKQ
jgi:hypothetical protein